MYQQTFYAVYEDGSTGVLTVESQDAGSVITPALTKPGRLVTGEEYDRAQAGLRADRDVYVTRLREADRERVSADYRALAALGVPDATARRLTGWSVEMEELG